VRGFGFGDVGRTREGGGRVVELRCVACMVGACEEEVEEVYVCGGSPRFVELQFTSIDH
jgi:hypothetical protein